MSKVVGGSEPSIRLFIITIILRRLALLAQKEVCRKNP